jgi:hypothetical protein
MNGRDKTMVELAHLRESLRNILHVQVLKNLTDLLEGLGGDRDSFVSQYNHWVKKNGPDCRYAAYAKEFFLRDQAESVAKSIIWLYHNFAKAYEKEEKKK